MNINKLQRIILAGALSLAAHTTAQAITIQPSLTTDFFNTEVYSGTTFHTINNDVPGRAALSWTDSNCGTCTKSHIRFDSVGSSDHSAGYTGDLNSPFTLGLLRFKNTGTAGLESTQLSLSVMLLGTQLEPVDLIFDISMQDMSNQLIPADQLTVSYTTSTYTFNTSEGDYRLDILGWSPDLGNTFSDTLTVANNGLSGMRLYGVVTAVPVPAAAWLFGSGLLALMGIARRKRA